MGDVHYHFHFGSDAILERLDKIMVTTAEGTASVKAMTAAVDSMTARLVKIGGETAASLAKIASLLERDDLDPALETALGELATSLGRADAAAKGVDDQVPDAP